MVVPNLELTITLRDGSASAALRIVLPNTRTNLGEAAITFDAVRLRALSHIPDEYGAALTEMVFVPPLREAWQQALDYAENSTSRLRLRVELAGHDALHALRWELLRDPLQGTNLACSERVAFSRFLSSEQIGDIATLPKPRLRALIAVSSATGPDMASVDVAGEVERASVGLAALPITVLDGREGRAAATLPALAAALRDEPNLLYLACHGSMVEGEPFLYLERLPGEPDHPIPASELIEQLRELSHRPLLVVLAACKGAGDDDEVLQAVGPQLARLGIGAVIAMAGNVPMSLVAALTPRLFSELERDGQIDRALAVARADLPAGEPWWLPTLWMATTNGALWATPPGVGVFQVPYPQNPLFRGRDEDMRTLATILLNEDDTAALLPALTGTGGIGKTQLASEFAHRYKDYFPGGVFWLNMAQAGSIPTQIAAAGGPGGLDLPGWAELDFEGKQALVRQAWNEPIPRLLVLDNLEDPALLKAVRPTGGGARLLITTRRGTWAATSGIRSIALRPLARKESLHLLLAPRWGEQVETKLADQPTAAAADAICEAVGDLPLALALAGAYLEQTPSLSLDGYHQRLVAAPLAHPSLEAELEEELPTGHVSSIEATIALSYERLDPSKSSDSLALTLLQLIARLAPAPIPVRLLVRLIQRDPDDEVQSAEVDAPIRRLLAVGLIDRDADGSVMLQRLIAAYVRDEDSHGAASSMQAANGLLSEIYAINTAGYPMKGAPYLPHLLHVTTRAELDGRQHVALLNNLGMLLQDLGDMSGARPHLEQSLAIVERMFGQSHPDTATALNNVGLLLQSLGDLAGAQPYLERALAIAEQTLGPTHPDTAMSLNNLGLLILAQGDLVKARPYFERALTIMEQVLGPTHPDTAAALNNLGTLLQDLGDFAGAQPHLERALMIAEQVLGPTHPDTALSLNNLGALLVAQGDFVGARPYYERALVIMEEVLGPTHPDTGKSLNNIGLLLQDLGELDEAQAYLERALAIMEQVLGPTHPDIVHSLNNLCMLLQSQGKFTNAWPYFERVLAIREQVLGPVHPDTGKSLNNMGWLLKDMGDPVGARSYLERALAIFTEHFGSDSPNTNKVRERLAALDA
jgi:Tfp pilus assembly protein PilF